MEATSFSLCIANYNQLSFPFLIHKQSFPAKPLGRKSVACNNKLSVSAAREGNNQDYEGKLVDDDMIVLRMRIRDMKMSEETQHAPPPNWMEWEKQYYGKRYNEDVCEAIGLLQMCLMNTRPCLALGMLALIALSVPISISVVIFYVLELANKGFLVPFHR